MSDPAEQTPQPLVERFYCIACAFDNLKPCIPERQTRNSFLQGNTLSHNDLTPESLVAPVRGILETQKQGKRKSVP